MKTINLTDVPQVPVLGHTSKGNQPKWQVGDIWYKTDHMGYETLAEVLISRLLMYSNVTDFVTYTPIWVMRDDKLFVGCASDNFRNNGEMLIPFERLHRVYHGVGLADQLSHIYDTQEKIQYTVNFIESATGMAEVGKWLTLLLELDAFFMNEDRHTNNLAVFRDANKVYRMSPVFDNGLALLSDLQDYPVDQDIYEAIKRVKAKPFSNDFDTQVDAAEELYGVQLKLNFSKTQVKDELDNIAEWYPERYLTRVEQLICEQMRRYTIWWK